jgi:hypothetical protein
MQPSIQKARENLRETKQAVYLQTATMVNSAFALVAALAWNEAIKAIIDRYIPAGSALYSKLIYALILTVIIVLVSMRLNRIIQRYKPEEDVKK